jgi:hypothetical protein
LVHRLLHHGLDGREIGHGCAVGNRLAAGCADFVHHPLGGRGGTARAVDRAAKVVDHHPGAPRRQRQRMLAAQAAAGPGDDRDTVLEIQ